MAPNDTPTAIVLLVISLLVVLPPGGAKELRADSPSPITIKVWPTVNGDEAPGEDYGPARVVATMATPFVELIDGGFFRKFHPVWTTVVVRERKNRPGLVGTLYRSHDNRTYVEVSTSGIPRVLFVEQKEYIRIGGIPRFVVKDDELVTREDGALLRIAQKFAETWERGVLHCEDVTPEMAEHTKTFEKMRVQADLWAPWERVLLGEPGVLPPTMEWIAAQTKRGEKVEDLGTIYENPAHYEFLKRFDVTFDSNLSDLVHNPDHIIKIDRKNDE